MQFCLTSKRGIMGTFIIVSNVMIVLSHTNYESSVAVMVGFVLREGGGGGGGLRGIVLVPWGTTGGATRDSASVIQLLIRGRRG